MPRKSKLLSAALKYQLIWPEPDPVLSLIEEDNADASAVMVAFGIEEVDVVASERVQQAHHALDHLDRSLGIRVRIAHGRNRLTRQTAEN